MIHFFIGTKAQFIKMAPVMAEMKRRAIAFGYVDSGQHADFTRKLRKSFGINEPDVCLHKNGDITSLFAGIVWTLKLAAFSLMPKKWLRKKIFPGGGICLIHGDTMSTLLGMKIARSAGLKVAHVEAGLRSFNIWHPFPEELIRIYCMKRCDFLFAPSQQAYENLKDMKVSGKVIKVDGNTVVDALRLTENVQPTVDIPAEAFALAACHRLETITRKKRLQKVVELFNQIAEKTKVVFVTHKPTRKYLTRFGLMEKLDSNIILLDMQDYINFSSLLRAATMVLADGGSIQEECAYLNKPCLILRNRTERPDGLGKTAFLWNFDEVVAKQFLENIKDISTAATEIWLKPSEKIVCSLIDAGF